MSMSKSRATVGSGASGPFGAAPGKPVGLARATARLGLANLVTNLCRFAWFEARPEPA
jgi:hypothetical protein